MDNLFSAPGANVDILTERQVSEMNSSAPNTPATASNLTAAPLEANGSEAAAPPTTSTTGEEKP